MNRQALYGFLLGLVVLVAVGTWVAVFVMPDRSGSQAQRVPLPSEITSGERSEQRVPETAPSENGMAGRQFDPVASAEPPPLFQGSESEVVESNGSIPIPEQGEQTRIRVDSDKLQRIQQELSAVTQSRNASPERVQKLLAELRLTVGRDEISGVNLKELEQTVEKAGRIQVLAREMSEIAGDPSKNDRKRIQELMGEMQRLQGQIPQDGAALRGEQ